MATWVTVGGLLLLVAALCHTTDGLPTALDGARAKYALDYYSLQQALSQHIVCLDGSEPCTNDPCDGTTCPAFPSAVCRYDPCKKPCRAEWSITGTDAYAQIFPLPPLPFPFPFHPWPFPFPFPFPFPRLPVPPTEPTKPPSPPSTPFTLLPVPNPPPTLPPLIAPNPPPLMTDVIPTLPPLIAPNPPPLMTDVIPTVPTLPPLIAPNPPPLIPDVIPLANAKVNAKPHVMIEVTDRCFPRYYKK